MTDSTAATAAPTMRTITEARDIGREDGFKGREFNGPPVPASMAKRARIGMPRAYARGYGEGERKRRREIAEGLAEMHAEWARIEGGN